MTYCTCPACGKQFRRQPNHVYHISWNNNTRYPCSYSCMNEMIRKKKEKHGEAIRHINDLWDKRLGRVNHWKESTQ